MAVRRGFFSPEETVVSRPLVPAREGCGACGLYKNCFSPRMAVAGDGEKRILIVAEAPGEKEDRRGEPLVGDTGKVLARHLQSLGINMNRDCWKTNAVACRPAKNATPTPKQIELCRPRLFREIERLKPAGIICLGGTALTSLLQHRWLGDGVGLGGVSRWRGHAIPDRDLGCWLCPTFHPAFVLRSKKDPSVPLIFGRDLEYALSHILDKEFPAVRDEKQDLTILRDSEDVYRELERIRMGFDTFIVFDWETTGLRPLTNKLISCAVATPDCRAISFPVLGLDKKAKDALRRLLVAQKIRKGAHHAAFEEWWSREKLGVSVSPWYWDSQLVAHARDNRSYSTSLKYQTYVNFGVADYDSHMKQWLVPSPDKKKASGASARNRVMELIRQPGGWETLLTYGGLDGIYEMKLALKQMQELGVPYDFGRPI